MNQRSPMQMFKGGCSRFDLAPRFDILCTTTTTFKVVARLPCSGDLVSRFSTTFRPILDQLSTKPRQMVALLDAAGLHGIKTSLETNESFLSTVSASPLEEATCVQSMLAQEELRKEPGKKGFPPQLHH